jgi:glycosyltransferase 2 family protein
MKWKDYVWPAIGLVAVGLSAWLLYGELRGMSLDDVGDGLGAIPLHQWILAALGSIVAYAALAFYDHIALLHIGKRVPWLFISLCSFTTYALSHNIGGSVLSGAVIRYRAYGSRGLTASEVGILVAVCWFTFLLATILLSGAVLVLQPGLVNRYFDDVPTNAAFFGGVALLGLVCLYIFGSWLHLPPLHIRGLDIGYPRPPIVWRQLIVGPIELIGAASIIYFALPVAGNPGFITVLGVFIASFSVAQISHAPGGLGVLEIVFLSGLPEVDPAAVIAALLVFRLFYLILPLALALVVVLVFERSQFARQWVRPLPSDQDTS